MSGVDPLTRPHISPKPLPRKMSSMQLHVELEDRQYQEFRLAVKKLGYRTVSEFIREQVRAAIKQAALRP